MELYTQLHALLPAVFSSYDGFIRRYCDAKPTHFRGGVEGLDARGSSNTVELKILLEGLVMIRRLKADVLSALPEKQREVVKIAIDPSYAPTITAIQKR